ncbi:CPBP family intramembrane glutamic endopeptidase [Methanobacterium sp. SMA-27]|uniref:CPBP family intramembrane glutamic endopeptidase n=1 Tax=Methanobacterium sp. SMA-27 TaxID=1495336 RepID=UPI00069389A2|nr:CPBP family intramembrane glutamic endopeptidase [Methanobacterium sp. SMA-27]
MFFPAIVALIFNRFVHRKSIKSMLGCVVKKPNIKSMVFSVGYPIIFIATCGIIVLIIGFGHLNTGNLTLTYIIISSIILILVNLIPAFGEEYGWIGYLLPKLTKASGKTRGTIILGAVWALYHFPVVLFTCKDYRNWQPLINSHITSCWCFLHNICIFLFLILVPW